MYEWMKVWMIDEGWTNKLHYLWIYERKDNELMNKSMNKGKNDRTNELINYLKN